MCVGGGVFLCLCHGAQVSDNPLSTALLSSSFLMSFALILFSSLSAPPFSQILPLSQNTHTLCLSLAHSLTHSLLCCTFLTLHLPHPLSGLIPHMRKLIIKAEAPPKKKQKGPAGAEAPPPPPKITHAQVFVSDRFVGWQEAVLHALQVRLGRKKDGWMGCIDTSDRWG